ncbi:MAG: glucosamine-6-phosphate deaminase [Candidatus Moranbacteria bacterium]|nr:glucosamine-6-phosphate deaminase [Candidatus Moranbacteria bacterium]
MQIIKCRDYDEVSFAAAKIVAHQIAENPKSVLGLPTGSTPLGMYRQLIKMYENKELDFSEVTTFNLDEYYPMKKDNDQSYYNFMHKNFFDSINIKAQNIYILNGEATDSSAECKSYEQKLQKAGGVDLQVLGIGQNGHIGFNEPDGALNSETHLTELTQNTIEANSRFFEKSEDVPTKSLTMGIGTILKAKRIIILAIGKEKAQATLELLSGKITTSNPATMLSVHSDVTLIADEDALSVNR